MYFGNISDSELSQYHNEVNNSFDMPLIDVLTSNLFKIETIISNSIYKVYPLFYCEEIISNNSNDYVLENKCIVCEKKDTTFLTFKSKAVLPFDFEIYYTIRFGYGVKMYAFDVKTNAPIEGVQFVVVRTDGVTLTGVTDKYGIGYVHHPVYNHFRPSVTLLYNGKIIAQYGGND